MSCIKTAVLVVLVTALVPTAFGQQKLGSVDFPTTCTSTSQTYFETGLALLHHMMYEQARDAFEAGAVADSNCAMAHWGIAMTQLHPLWAAPTDQEFTTGRDAVRNAIRIQENAQKAQTQREEAYISTIRAYFETEGRHGERLAAWEMALKELHEAHPDDTDAGAFFALAHLATASPSDKQFAHQKRAGALLEQLHERAPEHPGVSHYLIHAYDNPALATHAVDAAQAYEEIAPNVPHALHMPSHIFVRRGMWPEVVSWNARSAEAALQQSRNGGTSMHHAHALDYLMYAYLQQGRDEEAGEVLDQINGITNYQDHFAVAYGVAAAQARYSLEREAWSEAADLPVRTHSDFPWNTYPQYEALTYFTRGLGAARTGDVSLAQQALDTLNVLYERTVDASENYWATQVDVQRTTMKAWIAYANGQHNEARALMITAADLEDSVDKHPVTPGAVRPARELLGDMLVLLDRPEAAIEAYQTVLADSPNRFNSLYGMARAAETAGREDLATKAYTTLLEISVEGATERRQLRRAKAFLSER